MFDYTKLMNSPFYSGGPTGYNHGGPAAGGFESTGVGRDFMGASNVDSVMQALRTMRERQLDAVGRGYGKNSTRPVPSNLTTRQNAYATAAAPPPQPQMPMMNDMVSAGLLTKNPYYQASSLPHWLRWGDPEFASRQYVAPEQLKPEYWSGGDSWDQGGGE